MYGSFQNNKDIPMSDNKKPGRKKRSVDKFMLENLIAKYKDNDINEVVYRLTYAGKFIIIKGNTLCGSLIIISKTYDHYKPNVNKLHVNHLYKYLYDHYRSHLGMRFTVKVLAKKDRKTDQYQLLKREQMELDKNRYNKLCLNNATEPYIPLFNPGTDKFGWLEKTAVMNFKKWLTSKDRAAYLKRYCTQTENK